MAENTAAAPPTTSEAKDSLCRVKEAADAALAVLRPLIGFHSIELVNYADADLPPAKVTPTDLLDLLTACVSQAVTGLCSMGAGRQLVVQSVRAPNSKILVEIKDNCDAPSIEWLSQWLEKVPMLTALQQQGVTASVKPGAGKGSCFEILLPVGELPPRSSIPNSAMIVVEEQGAANAMLEVLQKKGYGVETPVSGYQALRKVAAGDQSMVFFELEIPGIVSSLVCCDLPREFPPHMNALLALSAFMKEHKQLLGKESLTTIGKPIDRDALDSIVDEMISNLRKDVPVTVQGGSRALVVDRSKAIQILLDVQLKRRGWQVDKADNFVQAVRKLQGARYDLVLFELDLPPNADGSSLYDTIKKDYPEHLDRILTMTAAAAKHKAFLESAKLICVEKPIHPEKLFTAIEKMTAGPELTVDSPRVMVAEESPAVIAVLEKVLRRRGCRVEKASTGYDALTKMREIPFELILLDIAIREMSGSILVRAASIEFPDRIRRFIVISSADVIEKHEQLLKTFDIPTVSKPVAEDQLIRAINLRLASLKQTGQ